MIYEPQGTSRVAGGLQAPERASQLGHTQSTCCRAVNMLLKAKTAFNSSIPLPLHAPAPLRKTGIFLSSHTAVLLQSSGHLPAAGKSGFINAFVKSFLSSHTPLCCLGPTPTGVKAKMSKTENSHSLPVIEFHHQRIWLIIFSYFHSFILLSIYWGGKKAPIQKP